MRRAARITLVVCLIGGVLHLTLTLIGDESRAFVDLPIYVYFAGPYVIVGFLAWWQRERKWLSRGMLAIAILVALSGIVAGAQYRGVETVGPFLVAFIQWIVLGILVLILSYISDRHRKQDATNRDVALRLIDAMCRGDLHQIESLLASTCRVQSPRGEWANRDLYLAALRRDPPERCRHRILSVTEGDQEVSVFFEWQRSQESVPAAQWLRLRNGLIVGMLLVCGAERAELIET